MLCGRTPLCGWGIAVDADIWARLTKISAPIPALPARLISHCGATCSGG
jgi:hypothetical protein